ncbi:MAG: class I SAM-dependent DNA methyltransferase [Actinomycetes bacterium]
MTLPRSYFDDLYDASPDPWAFRDRWYEQRKRDLTLAALPHPHYRRAFEPGCSIGALTGGLADRCDDVLAADGSAAAVETARRDLAGRPNVRVEQKTLPDDWPPADIFDLVVLSELGYYFDSAALSTVLDLAIGSLAPGGVLVACHWRHPVSDYPQPGDAVHAAVRDRPLLHRCVLHEETDFLLEVFTRGAAPSVAEREGLTP